jgi:hypothetical protein
MKNTGLLVLSLFLSFGTYSQSKATSIKSITTPTVKAISANCQNPNSHIILYNLPAQGTWTIKQYPKDTTIQGTGSNFAFVNIPKGSYKFTVTDSSGVTSDTTQTAIIEPSTTPPATPTIGKVIQPTQQEPTATITVNGLPSAKEGPWTLYISPGNLNFSGNDTTATIYGLNYGDYSFVVENAAFCLSQPAKVTIKNPEIVSGLDTRSSNIEELHLFPNPATDQITIERNSNAGIKSQYKVIDQLGVVVSSGIVESQLTIGLSHVTNGVYFFQLDNGTTIKFVKK